MEVLHPPKGQTQGQHPAQGSEHAHGRVHRQVRGRPLILKETMALLLPPRLVVGDARYRQGCTLGARRQDGFVHGCRFKVFEDFKLFI
jgi:hypothetical protein